MKERRIRVRCEWGFRLGFYCSIMWGEGVSWVGVNALFHTSSSAFGT
jgi:hypothetical protein